MAHWKHLVIYSVLLTWLALVVDGVQQERSARDGPRRQRRQQRNDRAKLVRQFLKRNGRLEGMVRLVDGAHDYEGLHIKNPFLHCLFVFSFSFMIIARTVVFECIGNVEIFHAGKWGSICDDEWDIREATVVCRELGFADVVRETHNSMYGPARRECVDLEY